MKLTNSRLILIQNPPATTKIPELILSHKALDTGLVTP